MTAAKWRPTCVFCTEPPAFDVETQHAAGEGVAGFQTCTGHLLRGCELLLVNHPALTVRLYASTLATAPLLVRESAVAAVAASVAPEARR